MSPFAIGFTCGVASTLGGSFLLCVFFIGPLLRIGSGVCEREGRVSL